MFVQVYVEYSNEVWNGIFRQAQYTEEKGAPLFPADPSFRQGLKYFNKRAAEVAAIWEQVRCSKHQALVYDIRPSTTAVFGYAIGSRKLSANEQFFVGAQIVENLLQTTQIIAAVCFITEHVAYANSNKTKIA